jgi:hypothetical protein
MNFLIAYEPVFIAKKDPARAIIASKMRLKSKITDVYVGPTPKNPPINTRIIFFLHLVFTY